MYAKIFRQIYESSITENPELRFTFMDLIVLADRNGVVDMTPESIARTTNRPLKVIKRTLLQLEGPDPRSRTPEENGARIKRLDDHRDWGWVIINFDRFRAIATDDQYREKTKERVRRYRQNIRKSEDVTLRNVTVTPCNAPVTHSNAHVTAPSASASAYVPASAVPEGGTGETIAVQKQKAKFEIDTRFTWLEAELCRFYKRPRLKVCIGEEEYAVMEVCRRPDVKLEWTALQSFRKESGERYFPQSLLVLCRDWDKTLDRARNHAPAPKTFKEKSIVEKDLDAFYAREGL